MIKVTAPGDAQTYWFATPAAARTEAAALKRQRAKLEAQMKVLRARELSILDAVKYSA
jgi:hypothetical protein